MTISWCHIKRPSVDAMPYRMTISLCHIKWPSVDAILKDHPLMPYSYSLMAKEQSASDRITLAKMRSYKNHKICNVQPLVNSNHSDYKTDDSWLNRLLSKGKRESRFGRVTYRKDRMTTKNKMNLRKNKLAGCLRITERMQKDKKTTLQCIRVITFQLTYYNWPPEVLLCPQFQPFEGNI